MSGVIIGGPKAYKVRQFGQIGVAFHWINEDPSVCFFPCGSARDSRSGAFVIGLSSLYKYFDSQSGMPTPYAFDMLTRGARTMGFHPESDRGIVKQMADVLYLCAPDLVNMPPEPAAIADDGLPKGFHTAILKQDGEVIAEKSLN